MFRAAEQTLPLSLLLCDERLTQQSHAPNTVLLLKMTLHTLLGFYAHNFEENGSQYVQGKTSFIWKTFASISQPSLAVPDQRSF